MHSTYQILALLAYFKLFLFSTALSFHNPRSPSVRATGHAFSEQSGVVVSKRSGTEFAIDWAEWQLVMQEVDDVLEADPNMAGLDIPIYAFGGISGLALGSRGEDGKTEDLDYIFVPSAPSPNASPGAQLRVEQNNNKKLNALQAAIYTVWLKRSQNPDPAKHVHDEYMNTAVGTEWRHAYMEAIVSDSRKRLFRGRNKKLKVYHASFGIQLINKMDRIRKHCNAGNTATDKDLYDSAYFLRQIVGSSGQVGLETLNRLAPFAGANINGEDLAEKSAQSINTLYKSIYANEDGFTEEVLDIRPLDLGCYGYY